MYEKPPSKEELAAFGLTEDDVARTVVVWEENHRAYRLFLYMQTQWDVGMAGTRGMKYEVMFHKMDRMKLTPDEYEQLESDMRTMEYAALDAMHTK